MRVLQQRLNERDEAFATQKRRKLPVDYYALKAKVSATSNASMLDNSNISKGIEMQPECKCKVALESCHSSNASRLAVKNKKEVCQKTRAPLNVRAQEKHTNKKIKQKQKKT